MPLNVERRQLGRCRATVFGQGGASWAIVLPGAGYSVQGPLLWYARRAALRAGRNVLVIDDVFDRERDDPVKWVEERVEATLGHVLGHDRHPVLIAKSMTSLAASAVAEAALPAVWFTPLIAPGSGVAERVVAGLRAAQAPKLLIGGTDDPSWAGRVASALVNAEVLELRGADHSLEVADDVPTSLDNLRLATEAVHRFIEGLQ